MTMQLTRVSIIVLLLGILAGCSWFKRNDISSSANNVDVDNDAPELLDKTPSDTTWYCYGMPDGSWDCQRNEKTDQVVGSRPDQT